MSEKYPHIDKLASVKAKKLDVKRAYREGAHFFGTLESMCDFYKIDIPYYEHMKIIMTRLEEELAKIGPLEERYAKPKPKPMVIKGLYPD